MKGIGILQNNTPINVEVIALKQYVLDLAKLNLM